MLTKDLLDIIALACAIASALFVGRTSLLKSTVTTQAALILTLEQENTQHEDTIKDLKARVGHLEAIVHANAELVGERHLASCERCRRRNSAVAPKASKNRNTR